MSLSSTKLKQELQKFGDSKYSGFQGFPDDTNDAIGKWASAFSTYISQMTIVVPTTANPTNTSLNFSGCKNAFSNKLIFSTNGDATSASNELSDAWESAIKAISFLTSVANYLPPPPTSPGISTILKIDDIPTLTITTQKNILKTALKTQFELGPTDNSAEALEQIANKLHTATIATMSTTCNYTNPTGSPATIEGAIITFG